MLMLGPLGFAAPWVLTGLVALPVLWVLLRAVPPAPREVVFPGTALLVGLADPAPLAQRTPWWLLMLRTVALAAAIFAFAGPVWKPAPVPAAKGPLLVVVDAGWAAAPGWADAQTRALAALDQARATGRPAALLIADGQAGRGATVPFQDAADQSARLRGAQPQPWETRYPADPEGALRDAPDRFATLWLTDGLDHAGRAAWLAALTARGDVTAVPPRAPVRSLRITDAQPPALRLDQTGPGPLPEVLAIGPDPQGVPRTLARLGPPAATVANGIGTADMAIDLPSELRNRVTRFALDGAAGAGAIALADDRVRRRKVALAGSARATERQALLSPLHYLRRALAPRADLIEGGVSDVIPAAPDVIILADQIVDPDDEALAAWVDQGGLLIRFAGPRMAAADALTVDPLLPVRLRPGGRDVGGALGWGEPRTIDAFPADGPFGGLTAPPDATVRAQLMAEPDPDLAARTLARLSDGTPLVTRAPLGQGQVVLFHTGANADWSTLPLSGLFVSMLDRLIQSARSTAEGPAPADTDRPFWTAETVLDGFGRPAPADDLAPVAAADFARGPGPGAPAGIYAAGARRAALNAGGTLVLARWPGATVEASSRLPGTDLRGWLIALAALLLAADAVVSGRLAGRGRARVWPGVRRA